MESRCWVLSQPILAGKPKREKGSIRGASSSIGSGRSRSVQPASRIIPGCPMAIAAEELPVAFVYSSPVVIVLPVLVVHTVCAHQWPRENWCCCHENHTSLFV